jgi:molecular chaperone DnaK (HSP70)
MTGLEQATQITPSSGLAPDEIDRLIMEAENSIETDRHAKEMIMQRNRLESLIKNTRASMVEFGKALPLEQQQEINGILNEAEEALETDDAEVMTEALAKVEQAGIALSEALMTVA